MLQTITKNGLGSFDEALCASLLTQRDAIASILCDNSGASKLAKTRPLPITTGGDRALKAKKSHLSLIGPFRILGPDGTDITPTSSLRQAVIAVIVLSPEARVSRTRLMSLFWPSSALRQAQASLRAALFKLRKDLESLGPDTLRIDDHTVAFNLDRFDRDIDKVSATKMGQAVLLEGLDLVIRDGEAFESWLREERRSWTERAPDPAAPVTPIAQNPVELWIPPHLDSVRSRVRLNLGFAPAHATTEAARLFATVLETQIRDAATQSGAAEIAPDPKINADLRLDVSVVEESATWQVVVRMIRRDSLQSTLVAYSDLPADLTRAISSAALAPLIDSVVDTIVRQTAISVDLGLTDMLAEVNAMYMAEPDALVSLREELAASPTGNEAQNAAIRSVLETFILGESLDNGDPSDAQVSLAIAAFDAVQRGQTRNPLEMTLAGYGLDFIAADKMRALGLMHEAVHDAPEMALAWDNLAITYYRHGDFERARIAAEQALKFGFGSPLIGVFETTYSMICLANGDTAASAYYGKRAMARNATYFSTQCHTAAALAMQDQLHDAKDIVRQIRMAHPGITLSDIEDRFMIRFPPQAQNQLLTGLIKAGLT